MTSHPASLSGISDELLLAASSAAQARTVAEQIEYWARLGQAIEPFLDRVCTPSAESQEPTPLSACLQSASSEEGRARLAEHLARLPFPHYEPSGDSPQVVLRVEADGKRTKGRFVDGVFESID